MRTTVSRVIVPSKAPNLLLVVDHVVEERHELVVLPTLELVAVPHIEYTTELVGFILVH